MARQTRWGERLNAKPGTMFTADFKDSDGDGVDDRMQTGPGQPKGQVGDDYKGGEITEISLPTRWAGSLSHPR